MKPESEDYRQCIERPRNHRSNSFAHLVFFQLQVQLHYLNQGMLTAGTNNATVGYLIVDANGGLNQMRMGVRLRFYCYTPHGNAFQLTLINYFTNYSYR